jgi:ABC-type sulfate transport system substrate-binding protein
MLEMTRVEEEVVLEDIEHQLKQQHEGTTITVTVGDGGAATSSSSTVDGTHHKVVILQYQEQD